MKKKVLVLSAALAAATMLLLTGCGERVDEKETEVVTEPVQTEAVTEIQIETQSVTELTEQVTETEPPTEVQTQAPTEPATEPDVDLPPDQEMAQEEELAAPVVYYASDDTNIRETPSTENSDNIISSYDQGEEVTVVAKTPHWYRISKIDGYSGEEFTGYVYKKFISETGVEPKTDEERAAAQETAVEVPQEEPVEAPAQEQAPAAAVSDYADSFSITISSDANIRADASEVAEVVGVVNGGTTVAAIGEAGDWYQIDYNGVTGFVNKNLVA